MGNVLGELRYAARLLKKNPVFTVVAVLTLALGIGANTAIFTLLDQILLRLLPVKDPQHLVLLTMRGSHYGSNWGGNASRIPCSGTSSNTIRFSPACSAASQRV